MDASPEDAARLRYIAGLIAAMIADLRSGVAFVQIAARFSALIEELLALLGRLPASVARIAVARFMDVVNLFGRLLGGASASPCLVLLGKALLVALVALLAHLGTRWVLEHCRYKGARLWDLLDDNWMFDWWYGVEDEDLSRCEKLYRAYLAYRKQRREMQAEGDIDFVHACAAAEARALSLWILECVDASSRPFWERELARVRALI